MDCGIPFCHNGCPVNNQIPDWNDLVYRGDWLTALTQPALDQQFPGVHRPHLPGAVRGVVHAQPHRRAGDHQDDRMRHRRPRLGGRLDQARAAGAPDRQARSPSSARGRRASPAPSSSPAPATRSIVYEKNAKPGGLLRYGIPDFKMEKHHVDRRVDADGGRGRHLPLQRPCRRRRSTSTSSSTATTRSRSPAAPRSRATCRSPGRDLDGIHFAMEFLPQQNRRVERRAARQRRADPRRRQARRRHRRRRHRLRLHRHLEPPGRAVGDPARDPAAPAGAREQAAGLAGLAAEAPHLVEPGGRRRPRLLGADREVHRRRRRPGQAPPLRPRRRQDEADRRHRVHAQGRPRAPRHGLPRPGAGRHDQATSASSSTSAATCSPTPTSYRPAVDKVFACGDMRRGQSLVVWAIREGRQARARSTSS